MKKNKIKINAFSAFINKCFYRFLCYKVRDSDDSPLPKKCPIFILECPKSALITTFQLFCQRKQHIFQ